MFDIKDFTYDLPTYLIPAKSVEPRDSARMIVFNRITRQVEHKHFYDIIDYCSSGDCLLLNNTKVIPCVLRGFNSDTGAKIEIKLTSRKSEYVWDCSVESIRELPIGTIFYFGKEEKIKAVVVRKNDFETGYLFEFDKVDSFEEWVNRNGEFYLPLYLPQKLDSEKDYQTVYAKEWGSMQPPVAGMHLTEDLMNKLIAKGVKIAYVTLHVGRLDKMDIISEKIKASDHIMYEEWYDVSEKTATVLNETKKNGNKVFAIGTTAMRTIESVALKSNGSIVAGSGWTDLYIYPGFNKFFSDALVSNLQPPLTTNLILACTFGGDVQGVLSMYKEAVIERYGFLEFGDCALYI